MICPCCEEERKQSDFINSNNCYKCEYKRKREEAEKKEDLGCKMCGNECPTGRWSYCSEECALLGKIERDSQSWTKKVKSVYSFAVKGMGTTLQRRNRRKQN